MNLEIKKNLTSNWFKNLQNAFCDNICKLEKNKIQFKSTTWKRNVLLSGDLCAALLLRRTSPRGCEGRLGREVLPEGA